MATLMRSIVEAVRLVPEDEVDKTLIIIAPGAIRFRRKE